MKKKWILLVEAVLLLVLLLLTFFGSGVVFETDESQLLREEETGAVVSKDFMLSPGMYHIVVTGDIANGGIGSGMEIGLEAAESTYHAMRGNRAMLPAGTAYREVTYYVTDKIMAAHVLIQPFVEEDTVSYEVKVEKTTAGRRMLFVMALLLCVCLDGILVFRKKVLAGEVSTQKKWTVCALVGIWGGACIPLLLDYLMLGTDSVQCLKETEYVLRGEWSRIPVLHLLYLWVPALVRWIGFPVATAYKTMIALSVAIALLLLYFLFAALEKEVRIVLPAVALGIWNPLAIRALYGAGNPGRFLLCVLCYAVIGGVTGMLLRKRKRGYKISPWAVFAVALVLLLQVVYFENTILLQSDVNYWYNEEPFMTGE